MLIYSFQNSDVIPLNNLLFEFYFYFSQVLVCFCETLQHVHGDLINKKNDRELRKNNIKK
jgi:hypothetical protein